MPYRLSTLGMSIWLGALLAVGVLALALAYVYRDRIPARWQVPVHAAVAGVSIDNDVSIAMSDGVRLAASLYRPRTANGRLATVLIRLPYGRRSYAEALDAALFFARHDYAVLVQDVRGTSESEGKDFVPWRHASADGAATLDWIVRQPWSNGKVGSFGCSALGELQFALARARHPAHAAMIASGAGGGIGSAMDSYEYFGSFEGGIFELSSGFGWFVEHGAYDPHAAPASGFDIATALRGLPVGDLVRRVRPGPNAYDDFLGTPLGDRRWEDFDYVSATDRLDTPSLLINTWGDQTVAGTLALAEFMRRQAGPGDEERHHVVIAPGNHCQHEDVIAAGKFGDLPVHGAEQPYFQWYLRLFDRELRGKGDGLAGLPAYLYFVIGENRWLSSSTWPPQGASPQRWYLGSGGHANGRDGDGALGLVPGSTAEADEYVYDPGDPVPSRGGPVCCSGDARVRSGPVDQVDVETRKDVLVYTSAPLQQPLRIAGPLRAHLRVSSSARDTDFIARLVDVWPDGRAINIQEGALRARYRNGIAKPELMTPGQSYALTVQMRSIAYLLPKGHRLRLDITSSSFPRLERNLNTGGRNFDETRFVVARNRILHGGDALSYLELPVLPMPEPR